MSLCLSIRLSHAGIEWMNRSMLHRRITAGFFEAKFRTVVDTGTPITTALNITGVVKWRKTHDIFVAVF